LTGTTSASHMAEDLQSRDFSLSAEEIATIEGTL
jgi:diketogulonate reductase-like aldo/keto reductase